MKRQFSFYKSGFTIAELMLVIAILAYLYYVFSQTSFRPQEYLTKAERLSNRISSVLHDGLLQTTIGRMDRSTPPQAVTGVTLTFTTTSGSTGTGITWMYTESLSGSYGPPFFDNDLGYSIDAIEWTGGTSTPGSGSLIQIVMSRGGITFTGNTSIGDSTIVTFTTKYINMKKRIVFDRRTGRIEQTKY